MGFVSSQIDFSRVFTCRGSAELEDNAGSALSMAKSIDTNVFTTANLSRSSLEHGQYVNCKYSSPLLFGSNNQLYPKGVIALIIRAIIRAIQENYMSGQSF